MTDIDTVIKETIAWVERRVPGTTNEILKALSDAGYVVVPREPTDEIIDTLYGPYISLEADKSRKVAYRAMIAAWEKENDN